MEHWNKCRFHRNKYTGSCSQPCCSQCGGPLSTREKLRGRKSMSVRTDKRSEKQLKDQTEILLNENNSPQSVVDIGCRRTKKFPSFTSDVGFWREPEDGHAPPLSPEESQTSKINTSHSTLYWTRVSVPYNAIIADRPVCRPKIAKNRFPCARHYYFILL